MEDIHNFADSQYVPADRIKRDENLLNNIIVCCKLGVITLGVFVIGIYRTLIGWWNATGEPKNISGQVALVTGGANGLGRAISFELAKRGCHLAVVDVDISGAKQTCEELRALGIKAAAYHVDVSDFAQVQNLRQNVEADIGPVDILVNNAGIISGGSLLTRKAEDIHRIIDVNTKSQFWTVMAFLAGMKERRRGHIVSVCSIFGWNAYGGADGYCASKYAVRGMMDALAEQLRWEDSPIQLTTIYPNFINTRKEYVDKVVNSSSMNNDMFRQSMSTPEEVAARTVGGMLRNQRHVFMNTFSAMSATVTPFLPDILHDTLNDYLKPRFVGIS